MNTSWRTGRDAQMATNRATVNRFMAKSTPAYMFCITLLEETKWRNRSSLTTQPETRLSLHGVQVLGGTNVRKDGSKTGSSFTRHASPTNRSMAYRSFIELEFATALSKAGPSYERCTHCGGQSSDVQVHGVASVQVTPGVAPAQREVASTTLPFHGLVRRPPLSWRTAEYSASSRDEAPTTPAMPMSACDDFTPAPVS